MKSIIRPLFGKLMLDLFPDCSFVKMCLLSFFPYNYQAIQQPVVLLYLPDRLISFSGHTALISQDKRFKLLLWPPCYHTESLHRYIHHKSIRKMRPHTLAQEGMDFDWNAAENSCYHFVKVVFTKLYKLFNALLLSAGPFLELEVRLKACESSSV